jgi:ferredoxin
MLARILGARAQVAGAVRTATSSAAASAAVTFSFVEGAGAGKVYTVRASEGENLLAVAQRHDVPMEGACEGSVACSTCHVILPQSIYDAIPQATEREDDMLDMAPGLTVSSRLGCQVLVTRDFEGVVIRLPAVTRNFYVDGHKPPKHH